MNTGIYTITNLINGKIYVGSTSSFNFRKNQHFSALRNKNHRNPYLQNSFNKYGESNFMFEILDEQPIELCADIERYWITLLNTKSDKFGYNINDPTFLNKGLKFSDIHRKRLSDSHKGKRLKPFSEEHKKKISTSNKGRIMSEEWRRKIGDAFIGKKLTEEHKKKISVGNKDKKLTGIHKLRIKQNHARPMLGRRKINGVWIKLNNN